MNQIKSGFYWVKFKNERDVSLPPIFVAEYTGYDWYVPGIDYSYVTEDFIILSECLRPPTEETIMHTNEQIINAVNRLRGIHRLLGALSDISASKREAYLDLDIYERAKTESHAITQQLFPDAVEQDELVRIDGILLCYLSPFWWELVDAAIAKL